MTLNWIVKEFDKNFNPQKAPGYDLKAAQILPSAVRKGIAIKYCWDGYDPESLLTLECEDVINANIFVNIDINII